MRFLRENGAAFGVDPTQIAAVGFSAGGHLCGTLGTLFDAPEVADLGPGSMLRPDGLGLCYPVAVSWGNTHRGSFDNISGGDPELMGRLSLDRLVRPDMPPVFLWHTRDDGSVPCRNSLLLANAPEAVGVTMMVSNVCTGVTAIAVAIPVIIRILRKDKEEQERLDERRKEKTQ